MFLNRVREQSEDEYHALNGLIVQLSAMPEIDNETRVFTRSASGKPIPVYIGEYWIIYYRVDSQEGDDVLIIISIWESDNPPHTRL